MAEPTAFSDAVASVTAQFATVLNAPVPFLLVVGMVAFGIWKFLEHHYEGRFATKDELLTFRQAQIDDYKDKLGGATPDAAKARIDALEDRIEQMAPRRLTSDQRQSLTSILDPFRGSRIEIVTDAASADAAQLAHHLTAAFQSAGWHTVGGQVMGIRNPPLSGVALIVPNAASLSAEQKAVVTALKAGGLEFDLRGGQQSYFEQQNSPVAEILLTNRLRD